MTGTASPRSTADQPSNWRSFLITSGLLVLAFSLPLYHWARFALSHELYSHLVLIPIISCQLISWKKKHLQVAGPKLPSLWFFVSFSAGIGTLTLLQLHPPSAGDSAAQDSLVLTIYSLLLLFGGLCFTFLNRATLQLIAFPLLFLILLAPFPFVFEEWLESFLQHGSAPVAQAIMEAVGTPVFRDGTFFTLPGFKMHLAPECSGIHSTLALFITSLVAGHLLLRSRLSRLILTLVVLPLALLRNGLRVATIGELCVHIGPHMIDSPIHHQGGPIFFALSLIPFSLLLLYLIKLDRRRANTVPPPTA